MRLISSWQRLRGSGVGPQSGPQDPRAWTLPHLRISDPPKSTSLFRILTERTPTLKAECAVSHVDGLEIQQ